MKHKTHAKQHWMRLGQKLASQLKRSDIKPKMNLLIILGVIQILNCLFFNNNYFNY